MSKEIGKIKKIAFNVMSLSIEEAGIVSFDIDRIIIHGLSMGGGIALDLSDKNMKNVKCIISDAPSVSIKDFFEDVAKFAFKKEGDKVAACAIERFQSEFNVNVKDFESVDIVSNSKYPILLSAGSNENKEELFEKIKSVNPNTT